MKIDSSTARKERRKKPYSAPTFRDQKGANRHPISGLDLSLIEQRKMKLRGQS